jgi:hypothetical protein
MQWASGAVSLSPDDQAAVPDFNPGPAEIDIPGEPAEALRDLFRDAVLPGACAMPSGARGLPTDGAAVDVVMAHLGSEQPALAPGADDKTPEAVSPAAPAGDRPEGGWRAKWLLPLACFLPLALDGPGRKGREEKEDEQKGKKPGR